MWAFLRLLRASWAFGIILLSYTWQTFVQRVIGRERMAKRWPKIHARNARRLYRGCVKLRGVFIKMGQVLSIMGTFLPREYVVELEKLQDAVPPQRFKKIEVAVKKGLGKTPDELFERFARDPVAAASLGQVHEATTLDGEHVAVKVLYPNIRTIMRIDLRVISMAMWFYKRWLPIGQIDRFLEQLRDMLERETNLEHEATCIERMAGFFEDDPDVLFPKVRHDLKARTVLAMSFMDGVKISSKDKLEELGLEPEPVAKKLVQSFYKMLFVDRFFHADPHPGNFFVQRGDKGQPRIVVLDLGSACEVRDNLVEGMLKILTGFMTRDDSILLEGIEEMGFVSATGDRAFLEATVKRYFQKLLDLEISDFSRIDPEVARSFEEDAPKKEEVRTIMQAIEYPLGWFYVERAALIMFGLSADLAPRLNTIQVGFPYVLQLLAKNPMPVKRRLPTIEQVAAQGPTGTEG